MRIVIILILLIVSFLGIAFLIHICAIHNYELEYSSKKRKIKIHPAKSMNESYQHSRGQS